MAIRIWPMIIKIFLVRANLINSIKLFFDKKSPEKKRNKLSRFGIINPKLIHRYGFFFSGTLKEIF